tara:strand:+ start:711 stop:830 length:120 start_codon:yes stop_codon:yes gene_type:complete
LVRREYLEKCPVEGFESEILRSCLERKGEERRNNRRRER